LTELALKPKVADSKSDTWRNYVKWSSS